MTRVSFFLFLGLLGTSLRSAEVTAIFPWGLNVGTKSQHIQLEHTWNHELIVVRFKQVFGLTYLVLTF